MFQIAILITQRLVRTAYYLNTLATRTSSCQYCHWFRKGLNCTVSFLIIRNRSDKSNSTFCSRQTLQHEILVHKPDHQTFVESSTHHTDICSGKEVTADLSVVKDEIASIDKRWNDLCSTVGDRLQALENIQEEIHRYQLVLRVTQKTLVEIEQIVVVEYKLVMDPNKAKQELAEVKVRKQTNIGQVI